MSTPLVLFAIGILVGGGTGYPLSRARWTRQAPRLAVAMWHALCFGVLSSAVLGGVVVALSILPSVSTGGMSGFLARCAMALRVEVATPRSLMLATTGALLALATIVRVVASIITVSREARAIRRAQLDRLTLIGRRLRADHGEGLILVPETRPAAYCLPDAYAERGAIVISTGTIDLLADDQLRLVLAHERSHLRQHHHVAMQLSTTLVHAFGWVPLFRLAAEEVPLLLEMAADDEALRTAASGTARAATPQGSTRRRLAQTLITLASAPHAAPTGALAAAGSSAIARVHRLSEAPRSLGASRTMLLGVGIAVAFSGPLLIAAAPALCAAAMTLCPFART